MMTSSRGKRSSRLDYAALEAGLPQPLVDVKDDVWVDPGVDGEASIDHLADEELRAAVVAAKAEREELARKAERKALERELCELKRSNDEVRSSLARDPPLKQASPKNSARVTGVTVADLRGKHDLASKVNNRLAELGFSDSSSESNEEEDIRRRRRSSRAGKKMRSGKTDKLTSKVVSRQLWRIWRPDFYTSTPLLAFRVLEWTTLATNPRPQFSSAVVSKPVNARPLRIITALSE